MTLIGPGNAVTLSKDPPWLLCLTKRSWRQPNYVCLSQFETILDDPDSSVSGGHSNSQQ